MTPLISRRSSLLLLTMAALAGPCRADVTVLHHWKLGEADDAGATTVTKDSAGTLDLTLTGTALRVGSTVPTSTWAMQITNNWGPWPTAAQAFVTNTDTPIVISDPANWGYECWVWMDAIPGAGVDSECTFMHIGDHSGGSQIMQLIAGNYYIHLPGASLADSGISAAPDIGKWVHLAMINEQEYTVDNGQDPPVITPTGVQRVRLFRNGTEIASLNGGSNGGTGFVTLGAQKLSGIGGVQQSRGLKGKMDDTRIFTFTLGSFKATDLLYPNGPGTGVPFLVTDFSIAGNGEVTLKWNSQPGKTYSVWESTDLSTWLENNDNIASGGVETTAAITPINTGSKRLFLQVRTP
jgi:hypothetical protein